MDAERKRLAAAIAAVTTYIQTEEEALPAWGRPKRPAPPRRPPGNLWGLSGGRHDADAQPDADENLSPTPLTAGR
jgi:hypothetical protein